MFMAWRRRSAKVSYQPDDTQYRASTMQPIKRSYMKIIVIHPAGSIMPHPLNIPAVNRSKKTKETMIPTITNSAVKPLALAAGIRRSCRGWRCKALIAI